MSTNHVVTDLECYELMRALASSTFDLSRRLPEQVFRSHKRQSLFCEYESLLGADFWPALRHFALMHGDNEVLLLTVDPSSDMYYFREYGGYAAFSLDVIATSDEYWEALTEVPSGDSTGAIVFSADTVAVTGPSSRWGCWGERSLGVAVFQGDSHLQIEEWREQYGPFSLVSGALEYYIAPNFGRSGIPPKLASAFLAQYA